MVFLLGKCSILERNNLLAFWNWQSTFEQRRIYWAENQSGPLFRVLIHQNNNFMNIIVFVLRRQTEGCCCCCCCCCWWRWSGDGGDGHFTLCFLSLLIRLKVKTACGPLALYECSSSTAGLTHLTTCHIQHTQTFSSWISEEMSPPHPLNLPSCQQLVPCEEMTVTDTLDVTLFITVIVYFARREL